MGHRGETLDQIFQQQIQIEGAAFQFRAVPPSIREVEDIVDDGQQIFPKRMHDAHEAALLLVQRSKSLIAPVKDDKGDLISAHELYVVIKKSWIDYW